MPAYTLTASPVTFLLAFTPTPLAGNECLLVEVRRTCVTGEPGLREFWFFQQTALGAASPVDLYLRWCVHRSIPRVGESFTVRVRLVTAGVPGAPTDVSTVGVP
ncbi:MAG: hypothetical protein ABSC21_24065 [Terriglobia bacterium]|jgi:hypothetical protein